MNLQLKQKYTIREKALVFGLFSNPNKTAPVDVLQAAIRNNTGLRLTDKNVIQVVRQMGGKLSLDSLRIIRTTPIGRGHKAVFRLINFGGKSHVP